MAQGEGKGVLKPREWVGLFLEGGPSCPALFSVAYVRLVLSGPPCQHLPLPSWAALLLFQGPSQA